MFVQNINHAMKRTTMRTFATKAKATPRHVVVVDGVRTPFKRSSTDFDDMKAYDLGRIAIKGLMDKTALKPSDIDYVSFGTVIQEVKTHNLARECALGAGLLKTTPAHTVSMACISSNQAITTGAEKILSGRADVILAGGAETMSDAPIRYNERMRKRLIGAGKAMKKGPIGGLKHFSKGFSMKELVPEAPAVSNFITGEVMGHSADRLAAKFGITREAQDEFAKKSHDCAATAHKEGLLASQIVPVNGNSEDNGVRGGTTMEDYQKLKPAFIKPHGTITAANASFMSDGASCSLIMSNTKAEELDMKPMAILKDWNYHAVDPFEELLLAPAFCIAKILKSNNLTVDDIDVWEIHEAFAGQVLANLAALESDEFSSTRFDGYDKAVGKIPHSKINNWGGSLSIGHPFGATGSRLVTTLANRLQRENKKYGICAACADSGLGNATLLENPNL
jgi:acetyl-CoA acyltransferase|eukprot:g11443.t1